MNWSNAARNHTFTHHTAPPHTPHPPRTALHCTAAAAVVLLQDFLLKYLGATVAVALIIGPFFRGHMRPEGTERGRAQMLSNMRCGVVGAAAPRRLLCNECFAPVLPTPAPPPPAPLLPPTAPLLTHTHPCTHTTHHAPIHTHRYHTSVIISLFGALGTLGSSSRKVMRLGAYAERVVEMERAMRDIKAGRGRGGGAGVQCREQ